MDSLEDLDKILEEIDNLELTDNLLEQNHNFDEDWDDMPDD